MRKTSVVVLLSAFLLTSCGPSYPKEKVAQSLEELCRREFSIELKAQVVGTTLGVLVSIPGLLEELLEGTGSSEGNILSPILVEGQFEKDQFNFQFLTRGSFSRIPVEERDKEKEGRSSPDREKSSALKTLNRVQMAISRVAASTDAPLEFYTLMARDPGPISVDVVFSGYLKDFKRVQLYDISISELQKRSRAGLRYQPEKVALQTVQGFFQDLSVRPLPQLLSRYTAPSRRFGEILPKILDLAVDLQGKEKKLSAEGWSVRQVGENEVLVYVPLSPIGKEGALLFTVQLKENQGALKEIERFEGTALPTRYEHLGPPPEWARHFYVEPMSLPKFLSDQIAKRVLTEFEPTDSEPDKNKKKKGAQRKPVDNDEVARALLETSAYVLKSYGFGEFQGLTVTDALKGTRWEIPAKSLPLYRKRNPPPLTPAS